LKISDFGLAKVKVAPRHGDEFQMTGETGSYRFMAPEVFRHEEYNETVDVYSFAIIFYILLTGKIPWSNLSGIRAVTKASMEGDRPLVERSIDAELANLMQRCWDENPHSRPSFETILHVLNAYSSEFYFVFFHLVKVCTYILSSYLSLLENVLKVDVNNVLVADEAGGCACVVM